MAAFKLSVAHFPVAIFYILWGVARPPVYYGLCLSHKCHSFFPIPGGGAGLSTTIILCFYVLAFFMWAT